MSESGRAPRERTSLGFNTHGFEIRGRAPELGGIVDAIPEADVVERARRHRLGRRHGRRVGASSRDSCAEGWVALDQPSLREKQRAETSFLRRRGCWRFPDRFVWVVARHWWRGRSGLRGNEKELCASTVTVSRRPLQFFNLTEWIAEASFQYIPIPKRSRLSAVSPEFRRGSGMATSILCLNAG